MDYIIPTKKEPIFKAMNDYFGYLENGIYKNALFTDCLTSVFALTYSEAITRLHEYIIENPHLVDEMPKSKWEITVLDGTFDKHGERVAKVVYSISSAKAKKYILNK